MMAPPQCTTHHLPYAMLVWINAMHPLILVNKYVMQERNARGLGARMSYVFYSDSGYCTVAALRCIIVEGPPPIPTCSNVTLYAIHTNV